MTFALQGGMCLVTLPLSMIQAPTVFLCSSFEDLVAERTAVLEAIGELQLRRESMELFGARPETPLETCLAEVGRSQLVVVIVGHRYGSMAPERDQSFSEAEYREAIRLNRLCLVYIRSDDVPVPPRLMELDPDRLRQLNAWKEELRARHTVVSFRDAEGLGDRVSRDLERAVDDLTNLSKARARTETTFSDEDIPAQLAAMAAAALSRGVTSSEIIATVSEALASLAGPSRLATAGVAQASTFISFADEDLGSATSLRTALEKHGIQTFEWEHLRELRTSALTVVEPIICGADYFLFLCSSASDGHMLGELDVALRWRERLGPRSRFVIPVLLDDSELPPLLRSFHAATGRTPEELDALARDLARDFQLRSG